MAGPIARCGLPARRSGRCDAGRGCRCAGVNRWRDDRILTVPCHRNPPCRTNLQRIRQTTIRVRPHPNNPNWKIAATAAARRACSTCTTRRWRAIASNWPNGKRGTRSRSNGSITSEVISLPAMCRPAPASLRAGPHPAMHRPQRSRQRHAHEQHHRQRPHRHPEPLHVVECARLRAKPREAPPAERCRADGRAAPQHRDDHAGCDPGMRRGDARARWGRRTA